ncbi:hypothetical protein PO909_000472 [Leuciscus waleckii]
MHAKAHEWSCEIKWSGRNQEGAGLTIGEEVEQVNSFLSRAAICTKYMSKAARSDMLTVLASAWNKRKSENLAKCLSQRYIKTTERLKLENESFASLQAELNVSDEDIQQWVSDVQQWATDIRIYKICNANLFVCDVVSSAKDDSGLEGRIRGLYVSIKLRKHYLYHQTGNGNLSTKKMVFDRVMLLSRLKEEEQILVMEVKQHWQSLKEAECSMRDLSIQIQNNNSDFELSEESSNGLLCLLKRKLEDLQFLQNNARMLYRQCVLGQASDNILFDNISDEETEAVNYSSDETNSDED